MPGRLLPSFGRVSASVHSAVSPSHSNASSRTSSASSIHDAPHTNPAHAKQPTVQVQAAGSPSPERRRSFHMDQLIHPHREHNKEKRRSMGRSARSKERAAKVDVPASVKLDVIVESPPLMFYGTAATSTGALFSGRLRVAVTDAVGAVTIEKLDMRLESRITTKKPVSRDCANCTTRTEELTQWNFIRSDTLFLKSGDHDFPFSYLFPGKLPASCDGSLGRIEYVLSAQAMTITGETVSFTKPLRIKRAILPGNEKSSIRIFPPTNLTSRVVLPSVVHPIGRFPVTMHLSGVVEKGEETQTRWRLRKMMWRIEEHVKIVSTACSKHIHKIGGEGKGVLHQETRIIGHNEEKSGWKTDFDTPGGEIAMEFEANVNPVCNPVCDLDAASGLEVKHNLVIELIVAEEFCPNRNTRLITPTGAARVLRMQFHLLVTERSGLGISWDEEMPPVYEDVPASPPGYPVMHGDASMEDYRGSPLGLPDYEELQMERVESLRLDRETTQQRGWQRFTHEDLTAEPELFVSNSRVEPHPSTTEEGAGAGSGSTTEVGH